MTTGKAQPYVALFLGLAACTRPAPVGARIGKGDEQIRFGGGYDHNFVLDRAGGDGLFLAARVHAPGSGRDFPSSILRPGQEYRSRTVYTFSARKHP